MLDDTSLGTKSKTSNGHEGQTDSIESGWADPQLPARKFACISNRCTEVSNLYMSIFARKEFFNHDWVPNKI